MLPAALGPLRNHTVSLDGCPDKRSAEPLDAGSPRRSILESSAKSAAACPPFRTGRSAQGKMAPSAAVPFIRSSPRESSHVRLPRRACAVRPKDNASGARLRGSPRPPIRLRRRRAQLNVPCLALPNRSGIPSATHAPQPSNQGLAAMRALIISGLCRRRAVAIRLDGARYEFVVAFTTLPKSLVGGSTPLKISGRPQYLWRAVDQD